MRLVFGKALWEESHRRYHHYGTSQFLMAKSTNIPLFRLGHFPLLFVGSPEANHFSQITKSTLIPWTSSDLEITGIAQVRQRLGAGSLGDPVPGRTVLGGKPPIKYAWKCYEILMICDNSCGIIQKVRRRFSGRAYGSARFLQHLAGMLWVIFAAWFPRVQLFYPFCVAICSPTTFHRIRFGCVSRFRRPSCSRQLHTDPAWFPCRCPWLARHAAAPLEPFWGAADPRALRSSRPKRCQERRPQRPQGPWGGEGDEP